jgi:hypothetical protein
MKNEKCKNAKTLVAASQPASTAPVVSTFKTFLKFQRDLRCCDQL